MELKLNHRYYVHLGFSDREKIKTLLLPAQVSPGLGEKRVKSEKVKSFKCHWSTSKNITPKQKQKTFPFDLKRIPIDRTSSTKTRPRMLPKPRYETKLEKDLILDKLVSAAIINARTTKSIVKVQPHVELQESLSFTTMINEEIPEVIKLEEEIEEQIDIPEEMEPDLDEIQELCMKFTGKRVVETQTNSPNVDFEFGGFGDSDLLFFESKSIDYVNIHNRRIRN